MEFLDLAPATGAAGTIRMPGSKSISNRTLLLAALARGDTELRSLLDSDDTRVMREALRVLGVQVDALDGVESLRVRGLGDARAFPVKTADLFLGNAGTAFRPLTAVLALSDGEYRLSGVPRMHERPIADLVTALRGAGARIDYLGAPGYPPLAIHPRSAGGVNRATVRGDVSSQFLSSLLMAFGWRGEAARIEVEGDLISKPYVALTMRLMSRFGVVVWHEDWTSFEISAQGGYRAPDTLHVEGDASSASYFLAAGMLGGGPVRVEGVGLSSSQGDLDFVGVLEMMGARVRMDEDSIEVRGTHECTPFDLDFKEMPDAAMTAAVVALYASGSSRLRNIASWRVKETDRIAAMATELRKFGAQVEEGPDFLEITPPTLFPEMVEVETYDDHRMAMCFSLATFAGTRVRILDPGCVAKTFPTYFDEFRRIVS
jgi:3-phosphoshikimate 1-carboxyvinyltransferase